MANRRAASYLRNPLISITLFSLVILATIGAKARMWRPTVVMPSRPQISAPLGAAQMVHFTRYDAGIFPREARVSAGQVVVCMEDMSGRSSGLVVQNELSRTLGQIVRNQHLWRACGRLALVPGRYQVFDASRPTSRVTLIAEQ